MKVIFSKFSAQPIRSGFTVSAPFFAALFAALILAPSMAMAQTLGDLMCNAAVNVAPFAWLMNGIAYIAGAVVIGSGLVLFVKSQENRAQTPLHQPIARLVAGAGLLFLPSAISLFINSLFSFPGSGGSVACVPGLPAVSGGSGITLDGLMTNLVMNVKDPMTFLLSVIACVIGVFLIIRGLIKASKYGTDPKAYSVPTILANIIIGTMLFVVGESLDMMLNTIFGIGGIGDFSIISWSMTSTFGANTQEFQAAVYAALTFVQLIGMIAFIRGFLILKNAVEGSGQATVAQGITHIIGGVLAINIYYFLVIMDNTFGTGFFT